MEALLAKLLSSIVEGSITYGPYCLIVTYMWLSEREERRNCQVTNEKLYIKFDLEKTLLTERVFNGLGDTTHAVGANTIALNSSLNSLEVVKNLLIGRGPPVGGGPYGRPNLGVSDASDK